MDSPEEPEAYQFAGEENGESEEEDSDPVVEIEDMVVVKTC